jgi:hypothetical protein
VIDLVIEIMSSSDSESSDREEGMGTRHAAPFLLVASTAIIEFRRTLEAELRIDEHDPENNNERTTALAWLGQLILCRQQLDSTRIRGLYNDVTGRIANTVVCDNQGIINQLLAQGLQPLDIAHRVDEWLFRGGVDTHGGVVNMLIRNLVAGSVLSLHAHDLEVKNNI